ncbi:MAG: hypothetical protein ACI84O_001244 [Myxococcota bacterium]|jgi:hypothetical protein
MTSRKILFLFAILALSFWGLSMFSDSLDDKNLDSERQLPPQLFTNLKELNQIKISRPRYGNSLTVQSVDHVWTMTEPLMDAVSPSVLALLSDELAKLRYWPLPKNLENQSADDLGLSTPNFVVETLDSNDLQLDLLIGEKTVQADFYIASLNGQLCLVENSLVSLLSRNFDSWRDHRLSSMGTNVKTVEWKSLVSDNSFTAQRESNNWRLTAPFNALLSETAASSLNALLGARLTSLGAPLPITGQLSPKLGDLVLSTGSQQISIGIFTNAEAVSSERDYVLHTSRKRIDILRQQPLELRSQRLLEFNPDHLAAIQVDLQQQQFILSRNSDGWRDKQRDVQFENQNIVALIDSVRLSEYSQVVKPRPTRVADGRIALSISRIPLVDKCPQLLWWVDGQGQNWIGTKDSAQVYLSDINYDLGVKSIVAVEH